MSQGAKLFPDDVFATIALPLGVEGEEPSLLELYGMDIMGLTPTNLSISTDRLTVRFNTNSLSSANATPAASPRPANPSVILSRLLVTKIGGDGRCTTLIFGILDGSRASSTRAFSSVAAKYL